MTWTVFQHQTGDNETTDDAPGRGGYSLVLVEADCGTAAEWWEQTYGKEPMRHAETYEPRHDGDVAWAGIEVEDEEDARAMCGEVVEAKGAIGIDSTRLYTWNELDGRLDTRVVRREELENMEET